MDYTQKHENNQAPDRSNYLFLEQMYGNVVGTSRYHDNIANGTEGLYCTSTSANALEIFKNRKLTDEEFSEVAKYTSSLSTLAAIETSASETRYLKSNEHEKVLVRDFPNGLKVVSTFRRV